MTLSGLPWPRRTDRCVVRPVRDDADVDAMWAYWGRPEVVHWTGGGDEDLDAHRERLSDPEKRARRLVVEHGGAVVGDLVLFPRDGWGQRPVREQAAGTEAEIGWAFDPAYAGRGLATETVPVLIDACLSPAPDGLGLRRVIASCFADNVPSYRLMERVGMRREAHHRRDSLHAELGWLDGLVYAVLADEWRRRPQ
ncbi:GNAT family N-acetyltransferase [Nocardioides sp. CFH 31398]|uniref:GNAT family N-acetyltransferase n=1 Tax=Nocardioides sp. CFH 31398 TaxID=2919579 RepID=UPI001F05D180|nr:GNAT family N-acetyltransferase [Nocardioides sp. CFH 31398]MCH1866669.1 GNAT family N-acetyltransferase [Nocardioides sp. CFH 31398]